jgi:hypothetical protein
MLSGLVICSSVGFIVTRWAIHWPNRRGHLAKGAPNSATLKDAHVRARRANPPTSKPAGLVSYALKLEQSLKAGIFPLQ